MQAAGREAQERGPAGAWRPKRSRAAGQGWATAWPDACPRAIDAIDMPIWPAADWDFGQCSDRNAAPSTQA
jgi:hypothetical protein